MSEYSAEELEKMNPGDFRSIVRTGEWTGTNRDVCRGYAFAGLVALPREYASDFLLFCQRNPRPCPVLDVTEPGNPHPMIMAPDADLRTDLPQYLVFKDGEVIAEPTNATDYWRDDMVAFLLGCRLGLDAALIKANVQSRYIGMFNTGIRLVPAGPFHGNMAVSCLAFPNSYHAVRAIQISSRLLASHGPPVHIGNPTLIGIKDISKPDFPLPVTIRPPEPHEITLFWGCAVTPQNVALESKTPYMIVQYQGRLFPTDKLIDEMAVM